MKLPQAAALRKRLAARSMCASSRSRGYWWAYGATLAARGVTFALAIDRVGQGVRGSSVGVGLDPRGVGSLVA